MANAPVLPARAGMAPPPPRVPPSPIGPVLPARAGMVPRSSTCSCRSPCAPRPRGDGPPSTVSAESVVWCSPPARGWSHPLPRRGSMSPRGWVLPACAGMVLPARWLCGRRGSAPPAARGGPGQEPPGGRWAVFSACVEMVAGRPPPGTSTGWVPEFAEAVPAPTGNRRPAPVLPAPTARASPRLYLWLRRAGGWPCCPACGGPPSSASCVGSFGLGSIFFLGPETVQVCRK